MPEPIRVLIADDHERFRRGLKMVLEAEDGIEVVAQAGTGVEAVERVEELAPDVVLMDVRMPVQNGIEATRVIRGAFPSTRIIMLTVSDDEDDLFDAVKAGANGYLLKEVSIEEVADAVRAVVQGQSLITPSMAAKLIAEFGSLGRRAEGVEARPSQSLTGRELEVLKRVAKGMGNEEIAAELGLTPPAVRNHVANILVKLQLRSRIEAALTAMEPRLLDS
ncbi:MAG TPA: response regulator transcription factor [Acidimicrobiales bacterium]|nr:response regulator transcription factor [Acidimicrobiales bacterium]